MLLGGFTTSVFGQQITILDRETNTPLEGVVLFSDDTKISTLTDYQGRANLALFEGQKKLTYNTTDLSLRQLNRQHPNGPIKHCI